MRTLVLHVMCVGLFGSLAACHTPVPHTTVIDPQPTAAPPPAPQTTPAAPTTAAIKPPPAGAAAGTTLAASDLRDVLAELDKGHHDKMQLGWWVNAPLLRSGDPVFKAFYKQMAAQQKDLAAELENWAKGRHMDLTYHYTDDTFSKAQKIMEGRQEKLVRGDNKENFDRDMLIDEIQDYEFTISLITALCPRCMIPRYGHIWKRACTRTKRGTCKSRRF